MRGFRVGVVNPATRFGQGVRDRMTEQAFPAIELKLLETNRGEGSTLAEFRDEIVVTQPLDPDLFPQLDLLFFAGEDGDLMNRMAQEAAEADVLTIVYGAVGLEAPVALTGTDGLQESNRLILVPRTASVLIASILRKLGAAFDVQRAAATVLLPVAEWGDRAAAELHQQFVSILSFQPPPTGVLGGQVAFNVRIAPSAASSAAEAVESEVSALTGMKAFSASLLQVPVFHGYSVSLWFELAEPIEESAVRRSLRGKDMHVITPGPKKTPPSPVSVSESDKIHVGAIRRTHASLATFSLWIAGDVVV